MNNPYNQFNIRAPLAPRFQAVPANNFGSSFNFHIPKLDTVPFHSPNPEMVQLPPPTAVYDYQRLYGATLQPNMPVIAINGSMGFNPVSQIQRPACVTNCNSSATVPPVIQLGLGNQPVRLHQRSNFPGAVGMGMCASVQQHDLLQQFVTGNTAAAVQNHIPVLHPEAGSVRHTYNVPTFPVVSVVPSNTANTFSADVSIPFREVQWIPPAVQQPGVPQAPYTMLIKPENGETPQNDALSGSGPVINTVFTVAGSDYNAECASSAQSEPTVYLDIAMDNNSTRCPGANKRMPDAPLVSDVTVAKATKNTGKQKGSDVTVAKGTKKTGKRKHRQGNGMSHVKALKLSAAKKLPAVKPCVVSLVRIDTVDICRSKPSDSMEEVYVADICKLNEPGVDASSLLEVQEVSNDQDILVPVIKVDEAHEVLDNQDVLVSVIEESEAQEVSSNQDDPIAVVEESESEEILSNQDGPLPVIEESEAEEVSSNQDGPVPVLEESEAEEVSSNQDGPIVEETVSDDSDRLIASDEDVGEEEPPHDDDNCSVNEDVSSEKSECYEVMPANGEALLFDMECDGGQNDETLRVILPTKQLEAAGQLEPDGGKMELRKKSVLPQQPTGGKMEMTKYILSGLTARLQRFLPPPKKKQLPLQSTNRKMDFAKKSVLLPQLTGERMELTASMNNSCDQFNMRARLTSRLKAVLPPSKTKQSCEIPTVVASVDVDSDDSNNDDVIIVSEAAAAATNTSSVRKPQCMVASAYKEKISAAQDRVESIELKRSENSVLGVPLQSSTDVNSPYDQSDMRAWLASRLQAVLPLSKSKQSCKIPAVLSIDVDADNSDNNSHDIVTSEVPTATNPSLVTRSQRLAASACKEKISATQDRVESIELTRSENSVLGVPLQSSFFRFEAQSPEVFRLMSMEKSFVPHNVLAQLTDLIASVDATAVDRESSYSDASSGVVCRIPQGRSRTLLFQCLFCPYSELSAKRVMAHVKQQHLMYASFIQRSLLPNRRILLHIYCRHCNFIAYDSAAMFIHFAVYHKVPGILLPQPKDIEQDPDWAPVINPEENAREFPFYCCPNCGYIDAEWNRIIQHMLKKHASESVFIGCVVRLIMFGRASKHLSSFTYKSLARQEKCKVAPKQIYACVSCKFFSFYPTYAFCHYVISHCSIEMLYVCAASPSCSKRCTSLEDVISHIQGVHVAMKKLQFQCTATLFDAMTLTQLDIGPGELITADVPVNVASHSSSASFRTSTAAAIEIDDDDDNDDDNDNKVTDDVVVLSPACRDDEFDDVEPDSVSSDEQSKCNDGEGETNELSSKSAATKPDSSELGCYSQEHPIVYYSSLISELISKHYRAENAKADVVQNTDKTLTEKASDTDISLVCDHEDQSLTKLLPEQNMEDDLDCRVEDEGMKTISCDSQCDMNEQDINRTESQPAQDPSSTFISGTSHTELANFDVDSEFPNKDADAVTDGAATVSDLANSINVSCSVDGSNVTESESVRTPLRGTSQTEPVNFAEAMTLSSKDMNQPTDSLTASVDLANHISIAANDDIAEGSEVHRIDDLSSQEGVNVPCSVDGSSVTESEAVQTPLRGTSETEPVISAEAMTLSSKDMNQPTDSLTACVDLVSDAITEGSAVHLSDDLSSQEGVHVSTVTEDRLSNPQSPVASTAEHDLLTSTEPSGIKIFSESLGFDDDKSSSSEHPNFRSDQHESSERCMLDLEEELLLLSEQLMADGLQPPKHCSNTESSASVCSVVSPGAIINDDAERDLHIDSAEDPCLTLCQDISDDTSCSDITESERLHTSAGSWLQESDTVDKSVRQGHCVDETSVPPDGSCNSAILTESRDLEVAKQIDSVNEQCSVSDSDDMPAPMNQLRFKSLAGFRFSTPSSFSTRPS